MMNVFQQRVTFFPFAGTSGWTPASKRQNGPGKKRRSCCIWPSWCPHSGGPSLPLLDELLPSAWSTMNTCCKDAQNYIMSLLHTLHCHCIIAFSSFQGQGGPERQWGRSGRRSQEIETWRNWPQSWNQTCQTRSSGHGWRFVFLAF